jgi:nucleotide-binding universal stress UspA family protein
VSVEFGDSLPVIAESVRRDRIGLVILGGSGSGWLERHTGMARYARRLARKVGATILTVQPKYKLAPAA